MLIVLGLLYLGEFFVVVVIVVVVGFKWSWWLVLVGYWW